MRVKYQRVFPFTGARGLECNSVEMYPMGPVIDENTDRQFVLYDPTTMTVVRTKDKAGTDSLFRVAATVESGRLLLDLYNKEQEHAGRFGYEIVLDPSDAPEVIAVNEFDDQTPVWDLGDGIAKQMSEFVGDGRELRVGQKTEAWLQQTPEEALERKIAPLHVVTTQTLRHLGRILLGEEPTEDQIWTLGWQLRAGMIVDLEDDEVDATVDWQEDLWTPDTRLVTVDSGNAIRITKPCIRYEVPGKNHLTGKRSELFVPAARSQMTHVAHMGKSGLTDKPTLGSYAVPEPVNGISFAVAVDQELALV